MGVGWGGERCPSSLLWVGPPPSGGHSCSAQELAMLFPGLPGRPSLAPENGRLELFLLGEVSTPPGWMAAGLRALLLGGLIP